MPMRLQEVHPALVHFPITMLPVTLATDGLGRATGNDSLMAAGRVGMMLTAGGAAVAAAAGLLAQESSTFDPDSRDVLVTHRMLNIGLVGLAFLMAMRRMRAERPSLRYLAAGLAGVGVMTYSAYLGGVMVYQQGVGVEGQGKLREAEAPYLEPDHAEEIAHLAGDQIRRGLRDVLHTLTKGELVPAVTRGSANQRNVNSSKLAG